MNGTDQIKQGRLTICYDYTPVPPAEHVILEQHFTDRYLAEFSSRVSAGASA